MHPAPLLSLSDGNAIPQLGYGLYKVPAEDARRLSLDAIDAGYRHLDTAAFYENEREVGEAVRDAPVPRDELFITSKVWKDDNGYDSALRAFDRSMSKLGLDVVDLYLIHWPVPSTDLYVDTWRALIRAQQEGRARSIGVSNFHPHHIDRLIAETGVAPVVDQVELHPWLPQRELREYGAARDIRIEAWSPLARGRVLGDATLDRLAAKHERTPAQIVLRWHIQLGNVVIPKASSRARIEENLDVFGFALDADDLAAIAALETGERTGRDPDFD
ncbi:aldo/keto reductase [Agromyces protaetiae]|uniref:Aldo/keto reductase n=1 Tax=Agromyces protaetiae TaxID=2509455 RepID=A0A4P6FBZ1_9MICO|nr:aldo/keto reductase [Agromyces protaetiae]QAY73364.1 aldo/keto reductase [Agromyces protaetiae]